MKKRVKVRRKKIQKAKKESLRKRRNKKEIRLGKGIWILLLIIVILGVSAFFGVKHYISTQDAKNQATEAMLQSEALSLAQEKVREHQEEEIKNRSGKGIIEDLIESAIRTLKGVSDRPPFEKLTSENMDGFLQIESCQINAEKRTIELSISAAKKALPESDDGYYYLFSMPLYETEISGEYIARKEKDTDLVISCEYNTQRLYRKFAVAVLLDGKYQVLSNKMYVTNPEALASHNPSFYNTSSKKGLLVDPAYVSGGTLSDLGVKHAAYNIPISRILGATTHGAYPTISYTYNGKTYHFNGHNINEYDFIFSNLTNKGIEITAILLNDKSGNTANLIHPLSNGGSAFYYAFNNTDEAGVETMAAVGSFLAERYAGIGHGKVMNWVISNEINARKDWNYIQYMDVNEYARICADSIRVFYNSIKSKNGNARVYVSIDQQWNRNRKNTDCYDARDVLDELNRYLTSEGNIDWCVAQHPYNYPLTGVKAWNMGKYENLVTNSADTSIITMKNIQVLTDYLSQSHFLNSKGEVRRVILSEVGYTSSHGQELQSANFVYAYKKIEKNPYIDSILLNRQTDHAVEVAQGLALGLQTSGGGHKHLYNVFKYIDTNQASSYCDFALQYAGLSSWSQIQ